MKNVEGFFSFEVFQSQNEVQLHWNSSAFALRLAVHTSLVTDEYSVEFDDDTINVIDFWLFCQSSRENSIRIWLSLMNFFQGTNLFLYILPYVLGKNFGDETKLFQLGGGILRASGEGTSCSTLEESQELNIGLPSAKIRYHLDS